LVIVEHFQKILRYVENAKSEARDALAATLHLRAAKSVEKILRSKMAVCCPACGEGITADEFLHSGAISLEIALAKKARKNNRR
jgi:hypothetical protein